MNLLNPTSSLPVIAPPLPLLRFASEQNESDASAKTISGEKIPFYLNEINVTRTRQDKLHNPINSRKLAKWFSFRSQKEVNNRHMEAYNKTLSDLSLDSNAQSPCGRVLDCTVYDSAIFNGNKDTRIERQQKLYQEEEIFLCQLNSRDGKGRLPSTAVAATDGIASIAGNDSETMEQAERCSQHLVSVRFDGEFESGNLEKAVRIIGRESLIDNSALNDGAMSAPTLPIDQEFDLTIRNDINTEGNIQWYYFSVVVDPLHFADNDSCFRVRLNLVNMQKKDSLYNYGMKPAVYCQNQGSGDWAHGGYDICYFRNGHMSMNTVGGGKRKSVVKNLFTLSFSYEFQRPGKYFFAHSFPYTYTDLQYHLNQWENDERISKIFHRRVLCETLAGNKCDVLTITDRATGALESRNKPSIVISSRIHPGESISSFMIHGLIDFLCSEAPEAINLRRTFIFTLVPMLNPDGVIHGNYRCSLAGTDLNRRYLDSHSSFHPTIVAFKNLLRTIMVNRPIHLFLDLHGHSKRKNCFLYGCDLSMQPEKTLRSLESTLSKERINAHRVFCRLFPKVLCSVSKAGNGGYFSYRDCSFRVDKSKLGTGRVVCWRDFGILGSYTIESSFCGIGNNDDVKTLRKYDTFRRKSVDNRLSFCDRAASEDLSIASAPSNSARGPASETGKSSFKSGSSLTGEALRDHNEISKLNEYYATCVHFQKCDYLAMGRHMAIAIHHFANLSHADLDYELEILMRQDGDMKERERRIAMSKELYQINSQTSPIFRTYGFNKPKPVGNLSTVGDNDASSMLLPKDPTSLQRNFQEERNDNAFCTDEQSSEAESVDDENNEESDVDDDDDLENDLANAKITASNAEPIPAYQQMKIDLLDGTMVSRVCARPSLFCTPALQSFVRYYPSEIAVEKSTMNLGLRIKCEIGIRKALRIDDRGLAVELDRKDFEERDGSDSGSDSNPSEDNKNAAKLLKQAGKLKGPGANIVSALRSAMLKAKKKEMLRRKKQELAAQKRLAKQALQAKKLAAEKQSQEAIAAERSIRPQTASSSREKLDKDVRTVTMPRFSPSYRLDSKAQIIPVQIKIMNFKPQEARRVVNVSENDKSNDVSTNPPKEAPVPRGRSLRPSSAQPYFSSRQFQMTSTNITPPSYELHDRQSPIPLDPYYESMSARFASGNGNVSSQGKSLNRKAFYG